MASLRCNKLTMCTMSLVVLPVCPLFVFSAGATGGGREESKGRSAAASAAATQASD